MQRLYRSMMRRSEQKSGILARGRELYYRVMSRLTHTEPYHCSGVQSHLMLDRQRRESGDR